MRKNQVIMSFAHAYSGLTVVRWPPLDPKSVKNLLLGSSSYFDALCESDRKQSQLNDPPVQARLGVAKDLFPWPASRMMFLKRPRWLSESPLRRAFRRRERLKMSLM